MKTSFAQLLFISTASAATLPSVGPDYRRPDVATPAAYRDADTIAWKTAEPAEQFARGEWWQSFHDTALNELEVRALSSNQDLRAAAARVEEARASAGLARSSYWPQVAANGTLVRGRTSGTTDNVFPALLSTTYEAPLTASWELDLFGRVRRLNESARAEAAASAATFESVRLALTSEVATTYFSLQALDRELAIVRDTTTLRQRTLDLIRSRVKIGSANDLDASRAEAELATTEADAAALANRRAAVQNALAVLVGSVAPEFSAATSPGDTAAVPSIPAGLPSSLLERRPDIAAAEYSLAAANARIGVAKAAFFPAISLTGSAGYASGDIDRLFQSDSRVWSIGPSVYLPIFQGGRNRAHLARSRAAFEEATASYRSRILVAFREVQDALTANRLLGEQSTAQQRAVAAAREAARLAQVRYDSGYVSYLEVLDAQRTALTSERAAVQLTAERLNATVALVKALGGGWHQPTDTLAQK